MGDLWTDVFTYSKGPKEGQTGVSLKARLLFISWIKIDGEIVYKAEPKATDTAAEGTGAAQSAGETLPEPFVASVPDSAEAPQLAASA